MKIEILIRNIRLKKNMTLETLAKISKVSKGNLSKVERGAGDVKLSTLLKIAEALDVKIDELYKVIK